MVIRQRCGSFAEAELQQQRANRASKSLLVVILKCSPQLAQDVELILIATLFTLALLRQAQRLQWMKHAHLFVCVATGCKGTTGKVR